MPYSGAPATTGRRWNARNTPTGRAHTWEPSSAAAPFRGTASGVYVVGRRSPNTFFARFAGITQWRILEEAVAVSGPTTGCTDTLEGCQTLPVTVPVTVFQCANNGKTQPINPPQAWTPGQLITYPALRRQPR